MGRYSFWGYTAREHLNTVQVNDTLQIAKGSTFEANSFHDESLSEVYIANKGDLGATADMFNQLEFNSLEKLPDTLDIGDVEESGHCSKFASQKLKKLAGEVTESPSSSLASAFVS